MYKCDDCGRIFETPKTVHDQVPYGSGYVQGPAHCVCPYCNGDYDEVTEDDGEDDLENEIL